MNASLSISVVSYHPDFSLLKQALDSIMAAIQRAGSAGVLGASQLIIVDNSRDEEIRCGLHQLAENYPGSTGRFTIRVDFAERNLGYGNAHNRAIDVSNAEYHLILNPDVLLEPDALTEGLRFMEQHRQVGMISPQGKDEKGNSLYLCKRFPTIWDLMLRGFAPTWLLRHYTKRLHQYEMRDLDPGRPATGIPIASGCFMLARTGVLRKLNGFDPRFFLYFEDFDLSLRMGKIADIAFVPAVGIIHYGGEAARKGPRHILLFIRSAVRFFNLHGWKLW